MENVAQYISQSMTFGDANWKRLISAIADARMYAVVSWSEVEGDAIFMAQTLIGPDGAVIHRHRKIRPSGGERDWFSDGNAETLQAITTPFGRIGILSCWENLWPTVAFNMHSQREDIHIASFPWAAENSAGDIWWSYGETQRAIARAYSIQGQTFTIMPAIGKAAIYNMGVPMNMSDTYTALNTMPFITSTVNTTTFKTTTFDPDGQYSWAALEVILMQFPQYIEKVHSTFYDYSYLSIQLITSKFICIFAQTNPECQ